MPDPTAGLGHVVPARDLMMAALKANKTPEVRPTHFEPSGGASSNRRVGAVSLPLRAEQNGQLTRRRPS